MHRLHLKFDLHRKQMYGYVYINLEGFSLNAWQLYHALMWFAFLDWALHMIRQTRDWLDWVEAAGPLRTTS